MSDSETTKLMSDSEIANAIATYLAAEKLRPKTKEDIDKFNAEMHIELVKLFIPCVSNIIADYAKVPYEPELHWEWLSDTNDRAFDLLEKHSGKIDWCALSKNVE